MPGSEAPAPVPERHAEAAAPSAEESSFALLARARQGDRVAMDILFARYLEPLRRWASGRLPRWARDINDTQDLVQDTLLATFKRLEWFEPEHEEALLAYLRRAVLNRIRNEFRRRHSRPGRADLDDRHPDDAPSPLDHTVAAQLLDRYEAAMERLTSGDRDLIVSRVELGLSYEEVAEMLGKPTANAARLAVVRALVKLTDEMGHAR